MRTVGVDLSAEPAGTAIAILDWDDRGSASATVTRGATDAQILAALSGADRAAVDCPLGWPEPFVEFLTAHRGGHVLAPVDSSGVEWRRTLSRRATDLACYKSTGVTPLSVAADRIAAVAMRGAGLLGALAEKGQSVDRAGSGLLVETYPAAALASWGLPFQRYKRAGNVAALEELVTRLQIKVPSLRLGESEPLCRSSDDAFDAVVCALVARAASLGLVTAPPPELVATAAREGWIVLPVAALDRLGT